MGYYTHYELTVQDYGKGDVNDKAIIEAIKEIRESVKDAFYGFWDEISEYIEEDLDSRELHLCTDEPVKWYDYKQEMALLSKKIPEVTFKLHGEGEEAGDVWEEYYLNGKNCRYTPVMPQFNPDDLE